MQGRIVRALIAAAVLVGGVALVAPAATATATTTATSASPSTAKSTVQWYPCTVRKDAKCGHVAVPYDPSDPSMGTIAIGFELHVRRDASEPSLGTIVATEGGPGYATTSSAPGYLALFHPLLDHRDILFVDDRGTGTSQPVTCPPLQSFGGNYVHRIGLCGQQLGDGSDLYGTAFAADDLALVLDALHIAKIDLYGDSYGTFFGQTFAVRHPDRLRTLILDSSYPVEGQDPWYRDENRAIVEADRLACHRSPACASLPGDPIDRIVQVDDVLRAHPLKDAIGFDGDGVRIKVTVDPGAIGLLVASAAYGAPIYRELDGAIRAFLDDRDPEPLIRMVAEAEPPGKAGPERAYSQGLYVATICNDYPQLWDINAPIADREAQYDASVQNLRATDPNAFYPFTIPDWTHSYWTEFRSCLEWPAPSSWVPPVPADAKYPKTPTLVLSGDLDSLTSPEGAHVVASHFPNSTFVSVANMTHVTAVSDFGRCTSVIVDRFVATKSAGDTTCASQYNEVREVEAFPQLVYDAAPAPQGATVQSSVLDRRLADVVSNTVADVLPRWYTNYDGTGVGLRGGRFSYSGSDVVRFNLKDLRWTFDVKVSGTLTWNRTTGWITADVTVAGPHTESGTMHLRWRDWDPHAQATVTGTISGRPLALTMPAS
jgi:pimeloyl-ACP methyl ester carboxylesterase